ncbi:hypothetical protein [Streptomyces sp. NPDC093094]|uniref:hypothetical protein n=1 Tax=Streptomyces sp. NPDC093094 TaxID=3366026 RepID=UPI00381FDAA6
MSTTAGHPSGVQGAELDLFGGVGSRLMPDPHDGSYRHLYEGATATSAAASREDAVDVR